MSRSTFHHVQPRDGTAKASTQMPHTPMPREAATVRITSGQCIVGRFIYARHDYRPIGTRSYCANCMGVLA